MVSPLGKNVTISWENLIKGHSGIKNIADIQTVEDKSSFPEGYIAAVHPDFDPKPWSVPVIDNFL
jgi:hypothetical protein